MSLRKKIVQNTFLQILTKIGNTALGIITFGLLTRYLGQVGYGEYTIITTYLGFFGVIADMGLSLVAIQLMSEIGMKSEKNFNNILTFRILTAGVLLAIAPTIALALPYSIEIKVGIALMAASFFFSSLIQILTTIFQVRLSMKAPSIIDVLARGVLLGGVGYAIMANWGLYAILGIITFSNAFQVALLIWGAQKHTKLRLAYDKKIWKMIITRSWPIAISIIFNLIYLKADTLVLSLLRPEAEVGIYGASYRVLEVLITFPMMFMGLLLGSFSQSWTTGNKEQFNHYTQRAFDFLMLCTLPMITGTLFLAEPIMSLVAGKEFIASGNVLRILILGTGTIFISTLFGNLINVIHKQKTMLWGYLAGAIVGLGGYVLFIPRYGYWAAAWLTVISEALICVIAFSLVYSATKIRLSATASLKIALATIIMGAFLYITPTQNLAINIIVATTIYTTILFVLKVITKDYVLDLITIKRDQTTPPTPSNP